MDRGTRKPGVYQHRRSSRLHRAKACADTVGLGRDAGNPLDARLRAYFHHQGDDTVRSLMETGPDCEIGGSILVQNNRPRYVPYLGFTTRLLRRIMSAAVRVARIKSSLYRWQAPEKSIHQSGFWAFGFGSVPEGEILSEEDEITNKVQL